MPTIDLIEPGEGTQAQNAFLSAVPPLNVFKVLAHTPQIAQGIAQLGGLLLYETSFDPKLREIAILRAAHQVGCRYEVVQHERIGSDVGLSDAEIAATKVNASQDVLDEDAKLICGYVDRFAQDGKADPIALVDHFGKVPAMELVQTVAYYIMVASLIESFAVPIEGASFNEGVNINERPEGLDP